MLLRGAKLSLPGLDAQRFFTYGLQSFSHEFAQFAKDFDFTHVTSSPGYPRSSGEAESAVKTIKSFLVKKGDFHKALLMYRATPLAQGSSSAQLMMGRWIQTLVPISAVQLQLHRPDLKFIREKAAALKTLQQGVFTLRHHTQTLPPRRKDHANKNTSDCYRPCTHYHMVEHTWETISPQPASSESSSSNSYIL